MATDWTRQLIGLGVERAPMPQGLSVYVTARPRTDFEREVYALRSMPDPHTYREIAEVLNTTVGRVSQAEDHLCRASRSFLYDADRNLSNVASHKQLSAWDRRVHPPR